MFNNFTQKLKNLNLIPFSNLKICFDLGTQTTKVAVADRGVVLKEATVLGLNKRVRQYIFFGDEAAAVTGKIPDFIKIIKPITSGIIGDFDAQVALVSKFIERGVAPYLASYRLIKPGYEVIAAVPSIATEIERKAVEEVFRKVGVSQVYLIEKALANTVGCGFNIFAHKPVLLADMGAGLVEIAVISGGGTVIQKTIKNGGNHMNKLVYNYVYLKHGLILGERTCEELKTTLLNFKDQEKSMTVRGKSLETGLPKSAKIKSSDVKEALITNLNQILDTIREIIELSPPEIVDEIYNQGIILSGGLASAPGIDMFFSQELKIEAHVIDNPQNVTINGLYKLSSRKEDLQLLRLNLP